MYVKLIAIVHLQRGWDYLQFNGKSQFTCQPTPRLRMDGGMCVALANLAIAIKPPVDCKGNEAKLEFSTRLGKIEK